MKVAFIGESNSGKSFACDILCGQGSNSPSLSTYIPTIKYQVRTYYPRNSGRSYVIWDYGGLPHLIEPVDKVIIFGCDCNFENVVIPEKTKIKWVPSMHYISQDEFIAKVVRAILE